MKVISLLLFILSFNVFAEDRPSCQPNLNTWEEHTRFNQYTGPNESCIYSKMNPEPAITNDTQSTLACFTSDVMSQRGGYPESIHVWLVDPTSCKVIATEEKCLSCWSDDSEDEGSDNDDGDDYYDDEDGDDGDYSDYEWF